MAPAFRRGGENATPLNPFPELCRKVALLISDDWLALSRCRPLLAVLKTLAHSLVVVTRSSGRLGEIEALGARVVDFDFLAFASNPVRHAFPGPVIDLPNSQDRRAGLEFVCRNATVPSTWYTPLRRTNVRRSMAVLLHPFLVHTALTGVQKNKAFNYADVPRTRSQRHGETAASPSALLSL